MAPSLFDIYFVLVAPVNGICSALLTTDGKGSELQMRWDSVEIGIGYGTLGSGPDAFLSSDRIRQGSPPGSGPCVTPKTCENWGRGTGTGERGRVRYPV